MGLNVAETRRPVNPPALTVHSIASHAVKSLFFNVMLDVLTRTKPIKGVENGVPIGSRWVSLIRLRRTALEGDRDYQRDKCNPGEDGANDMRILPSIS